MIRSQVSSRDIRSDCLGISNHKPVTHAPKPPRRNGSRVEHRKEARRCQVDCEGMENADRGCVVAQVLMACAISNSPLIFFEM